MNEAKALAVIENEYGSLEEFAYSVLTHESKERILDETNSILDRADALGLSPVVLSRILASPAFKSTLRTAIVNHNFGFFDEEEHIKQVVKVATGEERKVMSPKGSIGMVDQAPGDVIAAGRYLNDLRGTSVEQKGGGGAHSISIQILNANQTQGPDTAPGLTIETEPAIHKPRTAGALPPRGVLERGSRAVPNQATTSGAAGLLPSALTDTESTSESQTASLEAPGEASSRPRRGEEDDIGAEIEGRVMKHTLDNRPPRRKLWMEER